MKINDMYFNILFSSLKELINKHDGKVFWCIALVYSITIVNLAGSSEHTTNKEYTTFYVSDFSAFLTGAYIIRYDSAKNLYNINTQRIYLNEVIKPYIRDEVILTFRNPPLLAVLFFPLTLFEPRTAFKIYVFVSSLAVFLGIFILTRKLKLNSSIIAAAVSVFYSTISTLLTGQIGSLLLLVLCLIYVSIMENKFTAAGLLSTLLLLKPQYMLLIPLIFLATNLNRNYFKAALIGGFLFLLANVLVFGSNPLTEYLSFLYNTETYRMGTDIEKNYSLLSLYSVFLPNPLTITFITSFILYGLASSLYLLIKNNSDLLLFTGILIVFPLAVHVILADLIMSLPPFIFLISKYRLSKDRKYLLPAILIYLIPFIYLAKLVWLSSILYFFVVVLILRPANTTSRPSTIPRPNY